MFSYYSFHITNKNIPYVTSRNNYHMILWFTGQHEYSEYSSRREFNIREIHFQRCSGIMIYRERICPCVLFRHRRCVKRFRRGKKIPSILSFTGSLILTTMAETMRELTWTRKFPLQRTGNIFQRPAKPLQIHAVYDITASGESFVVYPAYRSFSNIKKQYNMWYNICITYDEYRQNEKYFLLELIITIWRLVFIYFTTIRIFICEIKDDCYDRLNFLLYLLKLYLRIKNSWKI